MSSFASDLRWPDDATVLQLATEGRVTFAVCRHCDGAWFSHEAIEGPDRARLPERTNRPRKNAPSPAVRSCPQCAVPLDAEKIDDVLIDVCPKCGGVWLDPGEYQAARRRSARIRLERDVPSFKSKTSAVGRAFDWVLDFIGESFIEDRNTFDHPFRRKPRDQRW
jgi:Zn-finger nucleic acid-binding protein